MFTCALTYTRAHIQTIKLNELSATPYDCCGGKFKMKNPEIITNLAKIVWFQLNGIVAFNVITSELINI